MWWRKQRNEGLVEKWFPIFNEKNTPDRLSYSLSVMEKADMYEVYIRDGNEKRGYLFEKMEGSEIIVKRFNAKYEAYRDIVRLPMGDVSPENVNGTHYYRGYKIDFDGLAQLENRDRMKLLAGIKRDQLQDKLEQKIYNSQKPRIQDRMRVLEVAIELYIKQGDAFGISKVAEQIFSHRWKDHPQKEIIERELKLALDSFVAGGELISTSPVGYLPTGKALTTIDEHATQARRHIEISKLQANTVWATFLAALAAVATALPVVKPYFISFFRALYALFFK